MNDECREECAMNGIATISCLGFRISRGLSPRGRSRIDGLAITIPPTVLTSWQIAYVFTGPLPWVGLLTLILLGRERMMRLKRKSYPLPETPPRVTVIVPAKDE